MRQRTLVYNLLSVETTELQRFSSTTAEKQGTIFNNKFIILLLRTMHKNLKKNKLVHWETIDWTRYNYINNFFFGAMTC